MFTGWRLLKPSMPNSCEKTEFHLDNGYNRPNLGISKSELLVNINPIHNPALVKITFVYTPRGTNQDITATLYYTTHR